MANDKESPFDLTDEQEPLPEDWQATVRGLQEVVCFLLLKNQQMRMALSDEKGGFQIREHS